MANIYQAGSKAVGKALSKLKSKGAPKAAKAAAESYSDKILGYTQTGKPIYAGPNEITQSYNIDDYQTAWAVKENERLNILTNISSLRKNSKELQARQEKLGSLEESMKQEFTPSYEDREKKYALDAIGNRSVGPLRERQDDLAMHFMENPVIPWDELSPEIKDSLQKRFNRPGEIYSDKNATEKYERRRTQLSQKQLQQETSPAPTTEQPTTPKETPPKPKLKEETALTTTPGAKLSRVEPITESEYIPPAGPEERKLLPPGPGTSLVPTGYGRTTFIAGERGISAGEPEKVLGPTREMAVFSEPGPFQERIREGITAPRPQANDTIADRISASQKLTKTQKAGAGLAAAGAAGMALRGGEEKKPEQPAGLLRPKITGESYSDIKFEPSPAELEAANSKAGFDGVRALWNTYSALNDEFQNKVKTEGFTTSDPKAAASAFLQTKQPATGPGILATPLTGDQFSAVQEPVAPKPAVTTATEKVKEKPAVTPAPPGGIAAKQGPQPKTIAESISGQVKTAETAQDAASAITDKLASGQQLTRADMLGLVEKINSIQPTPAQADDATVKALRAAREDARQAYREQATRNEWSEVAQTVSNAIANFIAAQQGLAGKPLALPQVDYGERTARALREYQTELGAITEQERALERGVERRQAVAEREAEASRRGWERYLMLGEKQVEAAERKAAQERDLATQLSIATAKREQEKAALEAAAKKEEKKAAKEGGKEQLSFLEKSIRQTEDLIKDTETKLKNATAVAAATDSKAFSEALPAYSIGSGVDLSQYSKAGIFSGEKYQQDEVKKQAKGRATELSLELQRLAKVREDKQNQYDTLLSGGQPTRPAAPAGQEPAAGGKVISRAKLAEYVKQTPQFKGDADAAQKFLESQGFSIGD